MIGASVCSGIGGAEVAAPWIGWQWACESERFPRDVLLKRFPHLRRGVGVAGDMKDWRSWLPGGQHEKIDILCGGTPCQSFSVAGQRSGMADPRGNLSLEFPRLAREAGARWIVWENVPGVLSSDGGRDFARFVHEVGKCGYGWAYRILDAHLVRSRRFPRALPQRRRRVFLVGRSAGDWRSAGAVLFEPEGLPGHIAEGGQEGRQSAADDAGNAGEAGYALHGGDAGSSTGFTNLIAHTLSDGDRSPDVGKDDLVSPTLSGKGRNAAPFGRTDRLVPAFTLRQGGGSWGGFKVENTNIIGRGTLARTLNQKGDRQDASVDTFIGDGRLRRLTPTEWERLQGFPDGWTDIHDPTPDMPRYKALGNAWAVNCAEWVLDRIGALEGAFS